MHEVRTAHGRFGITRSLALCLITGCAAMLPSATIAVAQSASGAMPCSAAVEAFDTEDTARVAVVARLIEQVMDAEDARHLARGEPSSLRPLSREGRNSITATAVAYCRDNIRRTVQAAAVEAYKGLRAFQRTMGTLR